MEKRIGSALILIENPEIVSKVNAVLSKHATIIIGRQGIPIRERGLNVISIILEGTNDEISSLTGQLGRLPNIQVKTIIAKNPVTEIKE